MRSRLRFRISRSQTGTTLIELLVTLGILGIFSAMMFRGLMTTAYQSYDFEIAAQATEKARTILDYMVYDLRVTGSGVPFMQSGYAIGDAALGTAPLPLLLDASSSHIQVRLNERGINTVTTADFAPATGATTIQVLSSGDYVPGDVLYLSDHTKGGTSGLRGVVASVTSNSITIAAGGMVYTAGKSFTSGTIVHRVSDVTYDSPADGSGIRRTVGGVTEILDSKSSFTLSYLDENGTVLPLPLTAAVVKDSLSSLKLTVTVQGDRQLKSKASYQASATQEISLRNLVLSR